MRARIALSVAVALLLLQPLLSPAHAADVRIVAAGQGTFTAPGLGTCDGAINVEIVSQSADWLYRVHILGGNRGGVDPNNLAGVFCAVQNPEFNYSSKSPVMRDCRATPTPLGTVGVSEAQKKFAVSGSRYTVTHQFKDCSNNAIYIVHESVVGAASVTYSFKQWVNQDPLKDPPYLSARGTLTRAA